MANVEVDPGSGCRHNNYLTHLVETYQMVYNKVHVSESGKTGAKYLLKWLSEVAQG